MGREQNGVTRERASERRNGVRRESGWKVTERSGARVGGRLVGGWWERWRLRDAWSGRAACLLIKSL